MIRTRAEYERSRETLRGLHAGIDAQRAECLARGLSSDEAERALQPLQGLAGQVAWEIAQYERWRAGQVDPLTDLTQLGHMLIALRIARDWSQRELAHRLGVSEAMVSRDEHNEYHGITVERAQRILDVLDAQVTLSVSAMVPAAGTAVE